jgi:hypothetical protein
MRLTLFILFNLLAFFAQAQTFTDSDIPIVIIDTYNQTIVDEPKINSNFKIIYNGPNVRNHLTDTPAYQGEIGIEIRGTYSQTFPQQSYGFETRDSFGATLDTSLLGMPTEHDWCLITTYNDKAFARNLLSSSLFTSMGHYTPRSRFCEVMIDGDYRGIYILSELIKRNPNRVNIAQLDSTENTYPSLSGGYIFKTDYWDTTDSWQSNYGPIDHPTFDVHFVYDYPKPNKIDSIQKIYLKGFVNQFETALYSPNFADPVTGYRQYADVLSFVDYFIINELSRNYDGFMHSFYFNKDKDNNNSQAKIKCGPVWDFDWGYSNIAVSNCTSFAATDGSGWAYLINDCNVHSVNSNGWFVRLLQDSTFNNLLRCRWEELRLTILDTAYLNHQIDSVAAYLNEAQGRHYARWGHLALNVGGCHVPPIPTTFAGHVADLKNWLAIRIGWLDGNIPGTASNCFTAVNENEFPKPSLFLFPNPSNDLLFIETTGFENELTITLFDQCGKNVFEKICTGKDPFPLNVSDFSNGIYILHVQDKTGKQLYRKVVVSH